MGNGRDENGNRSDGRQRVAKNHIGQHRVEDGHEELAVGEVLDGAVVIGRVVVRVQTRVRHGGNREETNRHQRAHRHERDEEASERKTGLAMSELQYGVINKTRQRLGKRIFETTWVGCAQSNAICPLATRA